MDARHVVAAPWEANLHKARRTLKKRCRICHQPIGQGEIYYCVRYRIGVDAHPHAVHPRELELFSVKGMEGREYPFRKNSE